MTGRLLINVDLGELPDEPEELYELLDVANVACGGHAGDEQSMANAVRLCRRSGARVGAHPSYPDLAGFGRRRLAIAGTALADAVAWQCARLLGTVLRADPRPDGELAVEYVKPHGALYHAADDDPALAEAVVDGAVAALGKGVVVIGPADGALAATAASRGLAFAREAFADRATRLVDGRVRLVPRGEPGAVIDDPALAAQQAVRIAASGAADTICVHGDTPNAVAILRAVRGALPG